VGTSKPYDAPPSWSDLKGSVTRAAKAETVTAHRARALIQGLVAHNGGRNEIARGGRQSASGSAGSAAPARDVASRFGAFIADVRSVGLAEAAAKLGLADLSGKPVTEILLGLLDRIGGDSSTIDDADARQALSDLQEELFAEAVDADELEAMLLDAAQNLESILERFFGYYIFEHFSRVFFERLVQRVGDSKASSFLNQIREFIQSALTNRAAEKDLSSVDWAGPEGAEIVSQILEQTLEVFGA
jgi:hypothetical protein